MKFLAHLLFIITANAVALWVAAKYIDGFTLDGGIREIIIAALIFTVLNSLLKPILKLLLGPIIILTLGLGLILVNALILYVLDIFSQNLTIEGISALVYSTILIGVINFVFHLATKK